MIDAEDIKRLEEIFVTRKDCNSDMDGISAALSEIKEKFAVIETKTNYILAVLGTIGVGVVGIFLNFLFRGIQ